MGASDVVWFRPGELVCDGRVALNIHHSGVRTVRRSTRSLEFLLCGANVVGPQRHQMLRQLVLGPFQTYSLSGNVQASAGARCTGRGGKCFSIHPPPRQAVIIPRGLVPSATGMEVDAPAGTTAGDRRSLRLQGLPPACYDGTTRGGLAGSLSHNTTQLRLLP